MKLERHYAGNQHNQPTGNHDRVDSRSVLGAVLLAEDCGPDNATDATHADQRRGAEGALPLAPDVVCLIGKDAGHVGVAGDGREEDAKVAHAVVFCESQEREADDAQEGVEEDEGRANVVFIA